MKLWTNNKFEGHWPVGTAAVVVAENAQDAVDYLNFFLCEAGLPPATTEQMEEMPLVEGQVNILSDGDY